MRKILFLIMCMFAFLANMQAAIFDDVTVDGVKYRAITDSTAEASIAKEQPVITIVPYVKIKGRTYKVVEIGSVALTFKKLGSITSVNLPNTIKIIYEFSLCYTGISSIIIPNSVEEIGHDAFAHCTNLKNIAIPSSVKKMGIDVFSDCFSLEEVRIPNSVIEIGAGCFTRCGKIKKIVLPDKMPTIPETDNYGFKASSSNLGIDFSNLTEIKGNKSEQCPIWFIEQYKNEDFK